MAKFTPAAAKKSLSEGVSLMSNGIDFVWAEFDEIEQLALKGFSLVNDLKLDLYDKISRSKEKKQK